MPDALSVITLFILVILEAIVIFFMCIRLAYSEREKWMLRRLVSDQEKLRKMNMDAYLSMIREAQRHTKG